MFMCTTRRLAAVKLETDSEAQAGPVVGVTVCVHGIPAGATELVHCCETLHRKEITFWFLAWERILGR